MMRHLPQQTNLDLAMERGSNATEGGGLGGGNTQGAMRRIAGTSLGIPLQYAGQTAALQLGHFAPKAVILGAHVTRLLVDTEADPGLPSSRLSEEVRKAAAAGQARRADEAELRAYDGKGESAASAAE
jgi:hypothetical protein